MRKRVNLNFPENLISNAFYWCVYRIKKTINIVFYFKSDGSRSNIKVLLGPQFVRN
jgi:hypothetical protein